MTDVEGGPRGGDGRISKVRYRVGPLLTLTCLVTAAAAVGDRTVAGWMPEVSGDPRAIAQAVTSLGKSDYMFLASAVLAVAGGWLARTARDGGVRERMRQLSADACYVFVAVAASGSAAQVLKHAVGRVRPSHALGLGPFLFHPFSAGNAFASFPSGHATSAFAAAVTLGLVTPRTRPVAFALAVAVSRVALGEHYPSDVVAGAALGATVSMALSRSRQSLTPDRIARGWVEGRAGLRRLYGRLGHGSPVIVAGDVFRRRGAWLPLLLACSFGVASPPSDLFGSELAEHVKDGAAIMVALAGLTLRGLVAGLRGDTRVRAGAGPASPTLVTGGAFSLCRNPLRTANMLVLAGIFLMHGNPWTVILGTATYALIQLAIVRAEEPALDAAFASAYRDHARRVPRWLPGPAGVRRVLTGVPFDARRALASEYVTVGATMVALTLAETYEELREPLVGGRVAYVESLATLALGVSVCVGLVWLARTCRPTIRA